jgi:hypothetical protein
MICLNPDILSLILDKIKYNDNFDLFILNKLIITKNFYIMIKRINTNIFEVLDKCFKTVISYRYEKVRLDPVTYYLLMIIHNMYL